MPGLLEAMEPLLDFPGVFVLGSNDYFAPMFKNPALLPHAVVPRGSGSTPRLPTDDLVKGLVAGGWEDLTNRRAYLTVGGHRARVRRRRRPAPRLRPVCRGGRPRGPSVALTIGVVHAPYQRVLDAMTADGAGLVIAGHTHGGQLALPGLRRAGDQLRPRHQPGQGRLPLVAGRERRPSSVAPDGAAWMHVSAGLGTSPYAPVRFACRPEATLLTLTAR